MALQFKRSVMPSMFPANFLIDVIYNQDCIEGMKTFPGECIDLIVTDCPYKIIAGGVTIEQRKDEVSGIFQKRNIGQKWLKQGSEDVSTLVRKGKLFENNSISFSDWLPEVFRILKPGCHCYIMISNLFTTGLFRLST